MVKRVELIQLTGKGGTGLALIRATVILLAIAGAIAGYSHFSRYAARLVLQVRTYEKGERQVQITSANGEQYRRSFTVGNDSGEPSFYVIALPRTDCTQVRVEPLAAKGGFGIDRVTLAGEAISYIWTEPGVCSRKSLHAGTLKREDCSPGQPELTVTADQQLQIAKIPADMFPRAPRRGAAAAIVIFLGIVISGYWFTRPKAAENISAQSELILVRICCLVLFLFYCWQFTAILDYSVDVPFWEEWEYFLPGGLPSGLTLDWLFGFAGYHRVVPTKFMAWLNLQLFGLDFRLQKIVNYLLFAGVLAALCHLKQKILVKREFLLFPAFLLFLLSPIAYENHSNSYQSQIHLLIILTLIALVHLYREGAKPGASLVFLLSLAAAINTFSGGMTVAAVLLPCWVVFLLFQVRSGHAGLTRALLLVTAGGGCVALVAASWISGYQQPSDCAWTSPLSGLFWDTFLNLVSFGFGMETEHPLPGVLWLLAVLVPLIVLLSRRETRHRKEIWLLATAVATILALLATISITRANFAGTAKASRYVEFGMLLIPLTALSWWLALQTARQRLLILLLLWSACVVTFADNWSFAPYRDGSQMDQFTLDTVEEYLHGKGDGSFPWTHPKPLPPFIAGARQLNVKFIRQFE